MSSMYVPTYLENVKRQFDGYPEGVTKDQKTEIEDLVRQCLIKHGTLSMRQIHWMIGDNASCIKGAALWDWIWACIDRALRAVGEEVYQLSENERYKLQHNCRQKKLDLLPLQYHRIDDNEYYREPGEKKEWSYIAAFCSTFPDLFGECDSNYEVRDILVGAGVLTKRNKFEAETCCLYLYFSSKKAAHAFVDRFNRWAIEKRLPERKEEFVRLLKAK